MNIWLLQILISLFYTSATIYGDLFKVKLQNFAELYESDAGHFEPSGKISKSLAGNTDAIKVDKLYSEDSKDEFPSLFLVYRKNAESLLSHDFQADLMDERYLRDVDENTYKGYVTDTDPTAELSGKTKSMDTGDDAINEKRGKKEPLYLTAIDGKTEAHFIYNDEHYKMEPIAKEYNPGDLDFNYNLVRNTHPKFRNDYEHNRYANSADFLERPKRQQNGKTHLIEAIFYLTNHLKRASVPEKYWIYIASDINRIYRDQSIGQNFAFRIKAIKYIDDRSYIPGDIYKSVWLFADRNKNLATQEADMHFVISDDFVTSRDSTPGYAIVGGLCTANGVATIQYTGLDSGFIMSHEMGHAFGCEHDDATNCRYDEGGVMASRPKVDRLRKWSRCSADTISKKLHNMTIDKTYCLNPVKGKGVGLVKYPGQYVFDEQCATRWGEPTAIMHKEANCTLLYCENNGKGTWFVQPPLDGTPCTFENGKEALRIDGEKICVSRSCIALKEMQDLPKGKWRAWKDGPCMGLGREFKTGTRECKRFRKNSVLGPFCEGARTRLVKCQTDKSQQELERWYADVNAGICRQEWNDRYSNITFESQPERPCYLNCKKTSGNSWQSQQFGKFVTDGTPITKTSICLKGVLIQMSN
ncbi:A disintegrin and metalloproteinase with thrombospondin motifs 3-like [Gordionus sp. m RMFG-2023]|uniref:A disintegrin and metalloproteinase with thrombospondin motifs 3-like n=1 Tax=Gordionus sp. m RMFG-2023 TaxID=3053472 RepID=UPI0031FC4B72